ncbi:unnamed protein product [Clavelina lepadiformis]|uniref:Uncharacterized protein n=1 Tax=Clavelina lepadiformis TaxID=159417 RepID=A0ABP0G4X5_CLALP
MLMRVIPRGMQCQTAEYGSFCRDLGGVKAKSLCTRKQPVCTTTQGSSTSLCLNNLGFVHAILCSLDSVVAPQSTLPRCHIAYHLFTFNRHVLSLTCFFD